MRTGRVIGEVWATKRIPSTVGIKWLLVRADDGKGRERNELWVAADTVDAGLGDRVVVVFGRAARISIGRPLAAIECATIGVIDREELSQEELGRAKLPAD